jgi:hypothetical protein
MEADAHAWLIPNHVGMQYPVLWPDRFEQSPRILMQSLLLVQAV